MCEAAGCNSGWTARPITRKGYLVGLIILFGAAYSQYFVGGLGHVWAFIVVYGIPILATGLLRGRTIVGKALSRNYDAVRFGLSFFGVFSILGTALSLVLLYVIVSLDPRAAGLLNRPNPVLNVSPEFAWVMVLGSLLVVGPAEEFLFRGFVFGGLLSIFKGRHWISLALVSSILFAGVHLYYAIVYGVASAIQFTDIVTFGLGMAFTYYLSGGNLLIPAFLHGAYDATGFIGVAVSPELGIVLRWSMMLIGGLVAITLFIQTLRVRRRQL
jgi:membrane protease YdiL (CAAX protease family)